MLLILATGMPATGATAGPGLQGGPEVCSAAPWDWGEWNPSGGPPGPTLHVEQGNPEVPENTPKHTSKSLMGAFQAQHSDHQPTRCVFWGEGQGHRRPRKVEQNIT